MKADKDVSWAIAYAENEAAECSLCNGSEDGLTRDLRRLETTLKRLAREAGYGEADPALKPRLDALSAGATPGPYGVESYGSGTTYLRLGAWVGHFADDRVPMMGGGRAEIIISNVPSAWGEKSRKGATAHFLAELANAYRAGKLRVRQEAAE